ncbi:unnamed protein product [Effrenium voratum]|uniref:ABC transporter domain-containing protein n=1 Tax=Effrenium voratum TaxID=2562239 RepID=A0AA36ND10_9DINO|nr:unnamed protein product [Effrenium voratum]CAJ1418686.1 unnamed protein product [Effrenium voratum]
MRAMRAMRAARRAATLALMAGGACGAFGSMASDPAMARWRQVRFRALQEVDLEIGHAHSVVLVGRSGAGKSTLLQLLADGVPESAAQFEMDSGLQRPLAVLDAYGVRADAAQPGAPVTDQELKQLRDAWGVGSSSPRSAKSVRWKTLCLRQLQLARPNRTELPV